MVRTTHDVDFVFSATRSIPGLPSLHTCAGVHGNENSGTLETQPSLATG
jgi:hypothetical protein